MEKYEGTKVLDVGIRAYMSMHKRGACRTIIPPTIEQKKDRLEETLKAREKNKTDGVTVPKAPRIKAKPVIYTRYITALTRKDLKRKSFIVADIETVPVSDNEMVVHMPYAVGFLLVRPGDKITPYTHIYTYFSEVYTILNTPFVQRSEKLLFDFIVKIRMIVKKERHWLTVYFHNFSKFDGIFIIKNITKFHPGYKVKPLIRNSRTHV
jgi:hypothetical protein